MSAESPLREPPSDTELTSPPTPRFQSADEVLAKFTAAEIEQRLASSPPNPSAGENRFSLTELLIVMTVSGVSLSLVRWLGPSGFAGAMGLVSLVWWILLLVYLHDWRVAYLIMYSLMGAYLLGVLLALLVKA